MRRTWSALGVVVLLLGASACSGQHGLATSPAAAPAGGQSAGHTLVRAAGTGLTLSLASTVDAPPWDLADAGAGPSVLASAQFDQGGQYGQGAWFDESGHLSQSAQYYQAVYDSLLRLTPAGEPTPNLATAWSYDESLTTLTLTLRDDVLFSDGLPLDAGAVVATLDHTRAGSGEVAAQLRTVRSVSAADATTVVLTLSEPDPSLLGHLGSVAGMVASPEALEDPVVPIGSGPYTLAATPTTAHPYYAFERNPGYWNAADFPFEQILLMPRYGDAGAWRALRSGQVVGAPVNPADVAAADLPGLTVTTYPAQRVEGVYIWDRAGTIVPALADVRVRQAINHAFDRAAIVDSLRGGQAQPTTQVFSPWAASYDAGLDDEYAYDPARARELLAAAGYPDGFEVTIPDLTGAVLSKERSLLVSALGAIGITVHLEVLGPEQYLSRVLAGEYAMSYLSLATTDPWDTIADQLTPDGGWNPLHATDPALAELVEQAQRATGDEQVKLHRQIGAYVVEQAWNAPWDIVESAYVTVKGIEVAPQAYEAIPPIYNFAPTQ